MKHYLPFFITFLLLLTSFLGVSISTDDPTTQVNDMQKETKNIFQSNSDHIWPLNMCNPQRTGRSIYDTSQNNGDEKWKYFIDSSIWGAVSIDNEKIIYVAAPHDGLHAIYPNGTIKWKIDLKDIASGDMGWEYQAPTIAPDGTIYIGTQKSFYAFYPNGTLRWVSNIHGNFWSNPVIDSQGTVYTSTQEGIIYAIYSNGTTKWERNIQDAGSDIALDKDENIYFYGYYNDSLTCLNPDGSVKWVFEEINVYDGPVVGDDGTIYLSGDDLTAIYPNGTLKWTLNLIDLNCYGYPSIAPDGTIILSGTTSYSSLAQNGIRFHSDPLIDYEHVTAVDPSDHSIKWQYALGKDKNLNDVSHTVIGADGTIFVTYTMLSDTLGYVCALSPDGTLKWKTQITSDIYPYNSMTILSDLSIGSDGTVYTTTWFSTEGSSIQGISSYGYVHAFGSDDEKHIQIRSPQSGYIYSNGEERMKLPPKQTLIFGDLHINCNVTLSENVKRITCILRSHHPFQRQDYETICQLYEIGLDTKPPYELVINASKFKYNFRFYTVQINVDYKGGCTASDRTDFFYIRKPKIAGPIPSPSVEWKYNSGSVIGTSPSINDNYVYFGNWAGDIFCLKASTGILQWKHTTTDKAIESQPLIVNSKVYVGSFNGNLYCLNAKTGDIHWTFPTSNAIYSSPKYWNGCVFFGSKDYNIYCIDADTGDQIWCFPTEGEVDTTPAVYDGKVYVSAWKDHFYCIDAITGEQIWKFKMNDGSSPTVDTGKVYFGGDRFLYCFNATNGKQIWSYETGSIASPPTVANGRVYFNGLSYFCGEYTMAYCVDAENGQLLWSYKIANDWEIRPGDPVLIFNGRVYGCYGDAYVYCHDALSGEVFWRFKTDRSVSSTPAYYNGLIYVSSWDWNLYCLKE